MPARRRSKGVFVTAVYEPGSDGKLRPELPSRCPHAVRAEACSLCIDHFRSRKTGPRFPLAVAGCSVHDEGRFTLYPPGHVPYGREAVTTCSPTGALLADAEAGEPSWEATLFAAAADAAEGERWPADSPWDEPRRLRTQGRRLELSGRLLGVHPEQDNSERERIAARLGVATMLVLEAARMWSKSWTSRGAAVLAVLRAVRVDGALLPRLLMAGAVAGLWSDPWPWAAARRRITPRSGRAERDHAVPPAGGRHPRIRLMRSGTALM